MSKPKNKERAAELEPQRIEYAVKKITAMGFTIDERDDTKIKFTFNGQSVTLYPYTGWFTGRSVKDGRGLVHLINQIEKKLEPCV